MTTLPKDLFHGLQEADRRCHRKHAKMWRRYANRGFAAFKGGAAKRWAWLKGL